MALGSTAVKERDQGEQRSPAASSKVREAEAAAAR
jgi:hypothetical protein